jgi:hypothetical protein
VLRSTGATDGATEAAAAEVPPWPQQETIKQEKGQAGQTHNGMQQSGAIRSLKGCSRTKTIARSLLATLLQITAPAGSTQLCSDINLRWV